MAVIPVLFALSLLAAVLLFKFFESTAVITTKEYKAGGAIAGFIIVFLMLFYAYSRIVPTKELSGTLVKPPESAIVVLGINDTQPDQNSAFNLKSPAACVAPNNDHLALYVLSPDGRFVKYNLHKGENLTHLDFKYPTQ
jgi:hypothetical protein